MIHQTAYNKRVGASGRLDKVISTILINFCNLAVSEKITAKCGRDRSWNRQHQPVKRCASCFARHFIITVLQKNYYEKKNFYKKHFLRRLWY